MTEKMQALGENLVDTDDAPPQPLPAAAERRVKIILEESDQIPPTGQFFSADGKPYVLRAGEVAEVPVAIINILDTAVMSVPVKDSGDRVIGYRDRLRFPYRVIIGSRTA